jgi:hypothetical protein
MMAGQRGTIEELFDAAADAYAEQRTDPRIQFHQPARIHLGGGQHPASTRNISSTGVGLKHDEPLAPGPVRIEIEQATGLVTALDAELLWCCRQGNHYISGAQFLKPLIARDLV